MGKGQWEKWFGDKLRVLLMAVALAVGSVVVDRFSDEIYAWVRSFFFEGFGGTYVLTSWTYPENSTTLYQFHDTVDLKDDGRTVFGVLTATNTGWRYKIFGYHRVKFLIMSYGGEGSLGGGTFALQTDIANERPIFWGWQTSVECIGDRSNFVECPALMYKKGAQSPEEKYVNFFKVTQCRNITIGKPPELCEELKARKPSFRFPNRSQ